jgi:hypothetical protein
MGTSFVKTDATVTGTAGLSFDWGSSAEGPPEQAVRRSRPAKKNLAGRRGLFRTVKNTLLLKFYGSPVTSADQCKPYAKSIIPIKA